MRHSAHQRPARRRRLLTLAMVTAGATAGALLPQMPVLATEPGTPTVLATTILFPGGFPASGAEVRLMAQPDPVWPTAPDGQVTYLPEVQMATAVADRAGHVAFDVPESPELFNLALHQSGKLRTVLAYTAQQGTEDMPLYFKGITPVDLTVTAGSESFTAPVLTTRVLRTIAEFDATVIQQLGAQTLADVGELVTTLTPELAKVKAELESEIDKRGYISDNEILAYNVHMLDGTITWLTSTPENFLAWESPDADVYDIVGLSSGGYPALDTTDAGDAVDDLTLRTAKDKRGKWTQHHGDCYAISGPVNQQTKKYARNVCYNVDIQTADTQKGTSFYQYEEDAAGSAINSADMIRIWVHGQPYGHGTAPMTFDALPQPMETETTQSNCVTEADSIYVESGAPVTAGISRTWTKTHCKNSWYGPVQKAAQGEHAAEWRTDDPIPTNNARHVALVIPVKSPTKEGCPIWNIHSGQWVDI